MRSGFGSIKSLLCTLTFLAGINAVHSQNTPPPHVVIPNPTPRQPDLEKVYSENSDDQKHKAVSIENQLRAREIWLESNQILLLAQELQQEIVSGKKPASLRVSAAQAGQIEKLAQSVQKKMKVQ
ncbi:hypothetical protein P8935_24380 [Telmatobacter sp. DSM 110680]|uniref:LTXXQ motif family protein n=1 Tax=Telmatobacter sp. DSM 110680 TaxID=3036704 RepID=A0AAU7DIL8_9BACT